MLNWQNLKSKKYFFMAGFGIVIAIGLTTASFFHGVNVQTPQNVPINGVIETDYVITDSSLGGVSAAITLSKNKQKFVMLASTNHLGGQATEQGVSTFDYWSRPFQRNSVLAGIVDNMSLPPGSNTKINQNVYAGRYSGNAIDGPGDTPTNIENYLKSQIDSQYGQILYGSRITDTAKVGKLIQSVQTTNQSGQKTIIKAKYFLDSQDTADLTRQAGVPWNFGLDTQEVTKERMALTKAEKDSFVSVFGNRTQPVTVPFTLFDKGYSGNRVMASELIDSEPSSQIACQQQKCYQIKDLFEQNINFEQGQKYSRIVLTFVQSPDEKLAASLSKARFEVNSQAVTPKIYPTSDNLHYQVELATAFDGSAKLVLKTPKPLKLLEVIADGERAQKEQPPIGYQAEEFAKIMQTKSAGGKLIQKDAKVGRFMKARQIVDSENLVLNNSVPESIAKQANFSSQGISQINTDQNDYLFKNIDQDKYLNDVAYRAEQNQKAKQWSQFYAYWLLNDAGESMLECGPAEAFCNTDRFEVLKMGVDSDQAFGNVPYTRDPVRPIGKEILNYNDLALVEHICTDQENCTELELSNKEMQPRKTVQGYQNYKINSDWLQNFNPESLFGFQYFVDLHSLVDSSSEKPALEAFYNESVSKGRKSEDLPLFISQEHSRLTRPGTVSLGNLYSDQVDNLMFCGKNISVSQLANSVTRLHPAESATGQSCGVIAKMMLENNATSLENLKQKVSMIGIQMELIKNGMWILPIEDSELRQMPPEILNSVYQAILKKQIPIKTLQNKDRTLKFVVEPSQKADPSLINIDIQTQKAKDLIQEYATQTKLKPLTDGAITKGELAWLLYNK